MYIVDIIAIGIVVVRCIALFCITEAAMYFNCPWLLLIYIAVPILSSPGVTMQQHKESGRKR